MYYVFEITHESYLFFKKFPRSLVIYFQHPILCTNSGQVLTMVVVKNQAYLASVSSVGPTITLAIGIKLVIMTIINFAFNSAKTYLVVKEVILAVTVIAILVTMIVVIVKY